MAATTRSATSRKTVGPLLQSHGVDDFIWIDPRRIVTAQWVRMKCMFGYPIAVRQAPTDEQNRYGVLLIR